MHIYKNTIKAYILFLIFIICICILFLLNLFFKQNKTTVIHKPFGFTTPTQEIIKDNIKKIPYSDPIPTIVNSKSLISIANIISDLLNTTPEYALTRQFVSISVCMEDKTKKEQLEMVDNIVNVMNNEDYLYLGKNDVSFGNEDIGTCKKETTCIHFFQKGDTSCEVTVNLDYRRCLIVECFQK